MRKGLLIMVLVVIGIFILGGNSSAQVNVNLNGDYLAAAANFFGFLQGDVDLLKKLNVADDVVPVVFYVAKTARVSPVVVANNLIAGKSWADISKMLGINPDAYYVTPTATVSGPPYGKAWGYYKKWPKTQWTWKNIALTNADVINLVNLKFLSKHYGYPQGQIVSMRTKGIKFKDINNNIVKEKKEKEKEKNNKDNNGKHDKDEKNKNKNKDKNKENNGNNGQGNNGFPSEPTVTTAPLEGPRIVSVSHNATGALRPGNVVVVTLIGDSDCKASFDIAGIGFNIPMTETSQGIYSGSFKIPDTAGNIRNAAIFGRLSKNGIESLHPAESGIGIDAKYVRVMKVFPEENSTVKTIRPNILIVLESTGGDYLLNSSANIFINNQRTGSTPTVSKELVSYVLQYDLPLGQNSIVFSATDIYGTPIKKTWYFNIETVGVLQSIIHNASVPLNVGEVLQVKMQGDRGGKATFDIGSYRTNNSMLETSPGIYVGSYQIQKGDSFQSAPVTGYLTVPGHSTIALNTTTPVSVKSSQISLQITAPQPGSTVEKNFTIYGVSSPYAKVSLNAKVFLGILGNGVDTELMTTQVQADESGNFQYQINDWFPVNGGLYTITALAQDTQGQQSQPVTVKVNRK